VALDLKKMRVPKRLKRGVDTRAFNSAVDYISPYNVKSETISRRPRRTNESTWILRSRPSPLAPDKPKNRPKPLNPRNRRRRPRRMSSKRSWSYWRKKRKRW
jgi:hypothetical protein